MIFNDDPVVGLPLLSIRFSPLFSDCRCCCGMDAASPCVHAQESHGAPTVLLDAMGTEMHRAMECWGARLINLVD